MADTVGCGMIGAGVRFPSKMAFVSSAILRTRSADRALFRPLLKPLETNVSSLFADDEFDGNLFRTAHLSRVLIVD
jgi:hypothetical protein